ncbi:MAG TPA: hypothetical protein PKW35_08130 [Nannocystaceae bacterium]|nr:hypothetical protein [Nannocystaceae bacterium]
MLRARAALATISALALAALTSIGCSAILNPENSDDVLRCGNADECASYPEIAAALDNQRTEAVCSAPGSSSEFGTSNRDQVCSVTDKPQSCDLTKLNADNPARVRAEEAESSSGVYIACAEANRGKQGCKPKLDNTCDAGLKVNAFGACDSADADHPAVEATADLKGLDVADQFCRSYFCDDAFVCNADSLLCVRCDPKKALGDGGCAELYVNGALSSVYVEGECPKRAAASTVTVGPLSPAQMP